MMSEQRYPVFLCPGTDSRGEEKIWLERSITTTPLTGGIRPGFVVTTRDCIERDAST